MELNEAMNIYKSGKHATEEEQEDMNQAVYVLGKMKIKVDRIEDEILNNPTVGLFANRYDCSDVEPYEIVRILSKSEIVVRSMKFERKDTTFQEWWIDPDANGREVKLRKQDGAWKDYGKDKYDIELTPKKYYKKIQ